MSDTLLVPRPPGIGFTAAELLAETERRARRLLGRTSPVVGATLVAGWPALLRAAAEVLDPHDTHRHLGEAYQATRSEPVRGAAAVVDRMVFEATAVGGPAVPTITHPAMQLIIDGWQQAAALMRRPGSPGNQVQHPGPASHPCAGSAADLRVVSTLTVVAHVTQVSLRGRPPRPLEPAEAERFRRMAQRHEQLGIRCLSQMTGPDPGPDTGGKDQASAQQTSTSSIAGQLLLDLKQWAPLATAVAADATSSVQDLRRIAQAEEVATTCAATLVAAAAERGELPPESVGHLQLRLSSLSRQWHQVAEQYGWVHRFGSTTRTPAVRRASTALTAALIDTTHNEPGPDGRRTRAEAATVAARFTGTDLIPVLRGLTENSAILADLFQRIPTQPYRRDDHGQLRPAFGATERVLRQFSQEHRAETFAGWKTDSLRSPDVLDVPVTATRNHVRAMTAPATATLRAAGVDLARAASSAEQALDLVAGPLRRRTGPLPAVPLPARPAPPPPDLPPTPGSGVPR
jgi:hypothetical protein